MKVLILAANGQIARIIEQRILAESQFENIELTLFLRNAHRLANLDTNSRVTLIEGSLDDAQAVDSAVDGQDLVFVAVVDHTRDNNWTKNVINAMQKHQVKRVIFTNILGIYNEVPGEFGVWNHQQVSGGLAAAINSDRLLQNSGLDYTTLRLPWLNDKNEVKYSVTHQDEPYIGVSGSRQSVADLVLKMMLDSTLGSKDSLGLADPATQGANRPIY